MILFNEKTAWIIVLITSLLLIILIVGIATKWCGLDNAQLLYAHGYCVYQNNEPLYLVDDYSIDEYGNLVIKCYQSVDRYGKLYAQNILLDNQKIIICGNWRLEYYSNGDLNKVLR